MAEDTAHVSLRITQTFIIMELSEILPDLTASQCSMWHPEKFSYLPNNVPKDLPGKGR